MKLRLQITCMIFALLALSISCATEKDDDTSSIGDWVRTTPYKGRPRAGAVSFTIGSSVFVGLGYDGDDYVSDFYEFDITKGYWKRVSRFLELYVNAV